MHTNSTLQIITPCCAMQESIITSRERLADSVKSVLQDHDNLSLSRDEALQRGVRPGGFPALLNATIDPQTGKGLSTDVKTQQARAGCTSSQLQGQAVLSYYCRSHSLMSPLVILSRRGHTCHAKNSMHHTLYALPARQIWLFSFLAEGFPMPKVDT